MGIGRNIKTLRNRRKMTQGELADKLNVTNKAISSWETDRTEPNMGMIEQMCRVFQCTKTELIDGTVANTPDSMTADFVQKFSKLSAEQQVDVLQYIDFLSSKEGR